METLYGIGYKGQGNDNGVLLAIPPLPADEAGRISADLNMRAIQDNKKIVYYLITADGSRAIYNLASKQDVFDLLEVERLESDEKIESLEAKIIALEAKSVTLKMTIGILEAEISTLETKIANLESEDEITDDLLGLSELVKSVMGEFHNTFPGMNFGGVGATHPEEIEMLKKLYGAENVEVKNGVGYVINP